MIPSATLRDQLLILGPPYSDWFLTQVCTVVWEVKDTQQNTIWGVDWLDENSWELSASVFSVWGKVVLTEK